MLEEVGFHFILLAAGEVLKIKEGVTAQDIQDFIQNDDAFGIRVPLYLCRLALKLLTDSGFLFRGNDVFADIYFRAGNDRV